MFSLNSLDSITIFIIRLFEPITFCVRDQYDTTAPVSHRQQAGSLNCPQFMLEWFIKFPEFPFHLGKTQLEFFRENSPHYACPPPQYAPPPCIPPATHALPPPSIPLLPLLPLPPRYGQWPGGTHPTGMHPCCVKNPHCIIRINELWVQRWLDGERKLIGRNNGSTELTSLLSLSSGMEWNSLRNGAAAFKNLLSFMTKKSPKIHILCRLVW